MRRAEPGHAAAFLVDQNRRIAAADTLTQRSHQITNLTGRATVALEQNEADWVGGSKEIAFDGAQALAGAAQDDRARGLSGQ